MAVNCPFALFFATTACKPTIFMSLLQHIISFHLVFGHRVCLLPGNSVGNTLSLCASLPSPSHTHGYDFSLLWDFFCTLLSLLLFLFCVGIICYRSLLLLTATSTFTSQSLSLLLDLFLLPMSLPHLSGLDVLTQIICIAFTPSSDWLIDPREKQFAADVRRCIMGPCDCGCGGACVRCGRCYRSGGQLWKGLVVRSDRRSRRVVPIHICQGQFSQSYVQNLCVNISQISSTITVFVNTPNKPLCRALSCILRRCKQISFPIKEILDCHSMELGGIFHSLYAMVIKICK